jgi:hypothetical protein
MYRMLSRRPRNWLGQGARAGRMLEDTAVGSCRDYDSGSGWVYNEI